MFSNHYSKLLILFKNLIEHKNTKKTLNAFKLKNYLKPEKPIHLGRWSIPKNNNEQYNYDKIHDKANMANYDHCDPCGREFNPKNFDKNDKK